jgi:hypothetical protein
MIDLVTIVGTVGISLVLVIVGYVLATFAQRGLLLEMKEQILDKNEEIQYLKVKLGLEEVDFDYNGWSDDLIPLDNKPVKN